MKIRVNGNWFECSCQHSSTGVAGITVGELMDVSHLPNPCFHIGEVSAVARNAQRTGGDWLSIPDPDCCFGSKTKRRIQKDIILDSYDDGGGFYVTTEVPEGIRQRCLQILQEIKDV